LKLLILSLFLLSCNNNFEPNTNDCVGNVVDCDGVCGGAAVKDECGVCSGDGSTCNDCVGNVVDCDGVCGGAAVEDACCVCGGDGSTCEEGWNVYYDSSNPIAAFQFDVDVGGVTLLSASNGAAKCARFTVSSGTKRVLGFSFSGALIPAGSNKILTILQLEGQTSNACISNPVIANSNGDSFDVEIIDCQTIREK